MKKIISLFSRNYEGDRLVRDEVVYGAEWVGSGEGEATRKYDGTCCMIREGILYKRYTVKRNRLVPEGFEPATAVDLNTGKQEGWVRVGEGNEDAWHREAFNELIEKPDGTFELCGPKVQGNAEKLSTHRLLPHGADIWPYAPRDFKGLKGFFEIHDIEGIVWHHPDGRMVKIKAKDFGVKRCNRD